VTRQPTFLAALRSEALALRLGARDARVARFGIGERAAKNAFERVSRSAADPVVLFGFSGALDKSLRPGDLVVATELGFVGLDETVALFGAESDAKELAAHGLRVVPAPVVTARRLVVGDEARAKAAGCGALAADMESWFFAPLARDRRFAVIRAIVDVPGREVRSASTPLAALRAAVALGRAARVMHQSKVLFEVPTSSEHPGES
jgi:4-hydroxy-3-methylbut-2-en-1-yl diphosphate reductase